MANVRSDGYVAEGRRLVHREMVEAVLGKPLPKGAEIHHVNDDRGDNRNDNFAVLQNKAEHRWLDMRRRIFRRGGRPFKDRICYDCDAVKPIEEFSKPIGRSQCKECCAAQARRWRARNPGSRKRWRQ